MNTEYVEHHKIFECIIGSTAYGTNTPESDIDESGVMIPDISYFYGLNRFDQYQDYDNDKTIYDFRKIIRLISENNPNCLDLLYCPDRCIKFITPYWQKVMDNKDLFLSKKCFYTYSGYAYAQLHRIKNHRVYLLNPPKGKPERFDFGLKEFSIFQTSQLKSLIDIESLFEYIDPSKKEEFLNQLDSTYADQIIPIFNKYLNPDKKMFSLQFIQNTLNTQLKTFRSLGNNGYVKEEYQDEVEKELKYQGALHNWKQYENWKKNRNDKRFQLESKYGFDTKHSMHLIRLMKMCKEILSKNTVYVDRTNIDANELKNIRNGSLKYDDLIEYANKLEEECKVLYETSTLQKIPQFDKINELCVEIIKQYQKDNK